MLPNGHSGSARDRQDAHLMVFGLHVAKLCSCMPMVEAMQVDCVILAHLQMHAFNIKMQRCLAPLQMHTCNIKMQRCLAPLQVHACNIKMQRCLAPLANIHYNCQLCSSAEARHMLPYRPVHVLQRDVTTASASAYRYQQTATTTATLRCKLRLLSCTVALGKLQALVALTCMSAEGQPCMQLLTSCAV